MIRATEEVCNYNHAMNFSTVSAWQFGQSQQNGGCTEHFMKHDLEFFQQVYIKLVFYGHEYDNLYEFVKEYVERYHESALAEEMPLLGIIEMWNTIIKGEK